MIARLAAATVVGGIVYFVLGFLIYGMVLENAVMKPNINVYSGLMKEAPDFLPLIAANLVVAFLLAYIFDQMAGYRSVSSGAKAGAIIAFLVSLSFQLLFIAFWNLYQNMTPPIADIIGSTVMGAIAGGVIGGVLGAMYKAPATA